MPPDPIQTDAAQLLIANLAACLEANDVHVPAHQGVVWCTECVMPTCCDHLVAVMNPTLDTGCIPAQWQVPVMYGVCYTPCAEAGANPQEWLPAQLDLAQRLEQALAVMVECAPCIGCQEAVSVEKFCSGGCAGFRLTFTLNPSYTAGGGSGS